MLIGVAAEDVDRALQILTSAGEKPWLLGSIEETPGQPSQVVFDAT